MTENQTTLTKQEQEELSKEIEIEKNRKEYYKKQLEMLKNKVKSGDVKDPDNFKIQSLPFDMRDLTNIENDLK